MSNLDKEKNIKSEIIGDQQTVENANATKDADTEEKKMKTTGDTESKKDQNVEIHSSDSADSSDSEETAMQRILLALRHEHELFKSFAVFLLSKLVKLDALKSSQEVDTDQVNQLETEMSQLVIEVAERIVDDEMLQDEEFISFKEKIAEKMNALHIAESD